MVNYQQISLPHELSQNLSNEQAKDKINLWEVKLGNETQYRCHAFIIAMDDANMLDSEWELYKSEIALYFQAGLKIDIEIWNIYIFFVVNEEVSREIKYRIEQDKYSCRKIVVSKIELDRYCLYDSEKLSVEKMLNKYLFDVDINKPKPNIASELSVKALVEKENPLVIQVLETYNPAINKQKRFYEKYLIEKGLQ